MGIVGPQGQDKGYASAFLAGVAWLRGSAYTRRVTLPARIRTAREAAGLSRPEAERRAGLAGRTLERWEGDKGEPGVLSLARLAPVLGVSLGALVGEVGEQPLRVVVEGLVARHGLPEVAEAVAEHVSVAIRGKA